MNDTQIKYLSIIMAIITFMICCEVILSGMKSATETRILKYEDALKIIQELDKNKVSISSKLDYWYPYQQCAKYYSRDELASYNFIKAVKNLNVTHIYYEKDGEDYHFIVLVKGQKQFQETGIAYSSEGLKVWRWFGF